MDPQTLPDKERALYNAVKEHYKVAFEPLRIREHQLHLLKITDLEHILAGRDPLKDVSAFPFWIKLWEAAIVLSEFIAAQPCERGTTVLELGAGLGAPGLTAAAAGYTVTLTDYEELILDFERINAAASRLTNVRFSLLDWLNPPEMERYDIILGAEILFREEFFEPLLAVLRKALKPDGVVYLAHDIKRRSLEPFLKMAEQEYRIAASQRKLKSLDEDKIILLTRLQPRH
ncbi:class I SAM-dependent methyltransferase [Desulfobulbus elongatus]|uniref:class I SAM-dependent methyltransferase n=1 Tax=Desulfobulbus elongatus TaxID=53332 RepID=UPI00054F97D9|nr:methyltransferase domain-containing protein [Desulfobulbus elongatus]